MSDRTLEHGNFKIMRLLRHRAEKAEATIESLQSQIPRWVPVEERLPDVGTEVLFHWVAADGSSEIEVNWLDVGDSIQQWSDVPTHWMPLPEPPLETEE